MIDGVFPLCFFRMYFSVIVKGSGGMVAFLSTTILSEVLSLAVARGGRRLGRAMPLTWVPFVVGVCCVCAEPGRRFVALEGEDKGRPALLAPV